MSGRIVYTPTPHERHGCQGRPPAADYPAGTLWECDECGMRWVAVEGAQYNERYQAWRDASRPILWGESRG